MFTVQSTVAFIYCLADNACFGLQIVYVYKGSVDKYLRTDRRTVFACVGQIVTNNIQVVTYVAYMLQSARKMVVNIEWRHDTGINYWFFVREIHRPPMDFSTTKG